MRRVTPSFTGSEGFMPLEYFAWGLLMTPVISILNETFPHHTFLMNGLIQGVKGFLSFLSAPLIGALSDIYGRKTFLLLTTFFTCCPIPLMLISPTLYFVTLSLSGVFAVTFSVVFAYVADVTEEHERSAAYGLVSATFAASLITSPAIGAYLGDSYSQRLVIVLATIISLLDVLFIFLAVPESLPESVLSRVSGIWQQADPFASFRRMIYDRTMRTLCAAVFFSYLAEAGQYSCFFVYLKLVIGFSEESVAFFIAFIGVLSCITQTLVLSISMKYFGYRRTLFVGLIFQIVQLAWYGVSSQAWIIWLAGAMAAMSSIVYPAISAYVSAHSTEDQQGFAQGMITGIRGLCNGLGPALYGFIFYLFRFNLNANSISNTYAPYTNHINTRLQLLYIKDSNYSMETFIPSLFPTNMESFDSIVRALDFPLNRSFLLLSKNGSINFVYSKKSDLTNYKKIMKTPMEVDEIFHDYLIANHSLQNYQFRTYEKTFRYRSIPIKELHSWLRHQKGKNTRDIWIVIDYKKKNATIRHLNETIYKYCCKDLSKGSSSSSSSSSSSIGGSSLTSHLLTGPPFLFGAISAAFAFFLATFLPEHPHSSTTSSSTSTTANNNNNESDGDDEDKRKMKKNPNYPHSYSRVSQVDDIHDIQFQHPDHEHEQQDHEQQQLELKRQQRRRRTQQNPNRPIVKMEKKNSSDNSIDIYPLNGYSNNIIRTHSNRLTDDNHARRTSSETRIVYRQTQNTNSNKTNHIQMKNIIKISKKNSSGNINNNNNSNNDNGIVSKIADYIPVNNDRDDERKYSTCIKKIDPI
ncbi:hypothetical protein SNEBB_001673 [Seison nebaliae]|nr:hypothetical protein SNEBB_001673 [Seison nebaliae]